MPAPRHPDISRGPNACTERSGRRRRGETARPRSTRRCRPLVDALEGRSLLAGVIHEYPLPSGDIRPYNITPGPDGNLWFTLTEANRVARITPEGVVTNFTLSTAGSFPYDIV